MNFKYKTFKKLLRDYLLLDYVWRDKLAIFLVRYERGYGLIQFLIRPLMFLGIFGIMIGIDLSWIPMGILPLLMVTWIGGFYTLGFLDIIFGFLKNQKKYETQELNPTFEEMRKDIKSNGKGIREIYEILKVDKK